MSDTPSPCPGCGHPQPESFRAPDRDGNLLGAALCPQCGLVWLTPRPSPEEHRRFYEEDYRREYKATWTPRPKHVVRGGRVAVDRCTRLARWIRPGIRTFDVGAGAGEIVFTLRTLGCDASGIEPNRGYAGFARDTLGLPVAPGRLEDNPPEGRYDLITLFHVLEHVRDPVETLKTLHGLLNPGGILWIEVPHVNATCQAPGHLFHRAHLFYFSRASLGTIAGRAGFRVREAFVSDDGGNLTLVLEATGTATTDTDRSAADETRRRLSEHTWLRHVFSPHPWIRPFRKLRDRWIEFRRKGADGDAKAVLTRLVREAMDAGQLPRS